MMLSEAVEKADVFLYLEYKNNGRNLCGKESFTLNTRI